MSNLFSYGQHFPNAFQAVQWVTSLQGTYREISKIEYIWNYYDHPAPLPENHPYNKDALVAYSNGENFTTCRDANAHLLFDYNHDGELDVFSPPSSSFAYMEHSGRGVDNEVRGNPFSNFWFDDNSLAKWMNLAYTLPVPAGLHEYDEFTRWRIVGGNATNWTPYSNPSGYNDQLALNGLYYLAMNQPERAITCWKKIVQNSGASFNPVTLQYDYPKITESYHFGLFLILSSMLQTLYIDDNTFLQHYISIRSKVLSIQIHDSSYTLNKGPFYGWTSDAAGGGSLMNTESVSTNVLGLGANAIYTYEFGRSPLTSDAENSNFQLLSSNVLSAVDGQSSAGYLSSGPGVTLGVGNYYFEFFARSSTVTSASDEKVLLKIEVYDEKGAKQLLADKEIVGKDFGIDHDWRRMKVLFTIDKERDGVNSLDFRVWYNGCESIDVSIFRIVVA